MTFKLCFLPCSILKRVTVLAGEEKKKTLSLVSFLYCSVKSEVHKKGISFLSGPKNK